MTGFALKREQPVGPARPGSRGIVRWEAPRIKPWAGIRSQRHGRVRRLWRMIKWMLAACIALTVANTASAGSEAAPGWQALLERVVDISSGTQNIAGLEAVRQLLIPELETLGFQVTSRDVGDGQQSSRRWSPAARPISC
jgi:hypothetical protein